MDNIEIDVHDIDGNKIEKMTLENSIFGVDVKPEIIHQVVVHHLASQRQGNACAKTRGEVRGGGKKPWKQKGTGRARAGSSRSPIWRGGGVIFAPKPRDYSYALPRKIKRTALLGALSSKYKNNSIIVINDLKIEQPKTKEVAKILKKFKTKKPLLLLDLKQEMLKMAARNIPSVQTCLSSQINAYLVLDCDKIIIAKESLIDLQNLLMKERGNA